MNENDGPGFGRTIRRLLVAMAVVVVFILVGGAGYRLLGGDRWTFDEAVFMTIITIFTVGFGELPDMHTVPYARAWTAIIIVFGVGTMAYVQGNLDE